MPLNRNIINVPNLLSAYRLMSSPFILWTILSGERWYFIFLLCVNLITDILDGLIARLFKLETEFGARLDSIADTGTFILAYAGMLAFEWSFVKDHGIEFGTMAILYSANILIALWRFKRMPSLHLYAFKINGYLQGIFLFTYFVLGYSQWYFYLMFCWSCLAYLEEIYILLTVKELKSNMRGLYFIHRQSKNQPCLQKSA